MTVPSNHRKRLIIAGAATASVVVTVVIASWRPTPPPQGMVGITTVPENATVYVGGKKIGDHAPITLAERPGTYVLSASAPGYAPLDRKIEVRAGERLELTLVLRPAAETALYITSEPPGAQVFIDGWPALGPGGPLRTNAKIAPLAAGTHVVELRPGAGFKTWREQIDVEAGALNRFHARLVKANGGARQAGAGRRAAGARGRAVSAEVEASDDAVDAAVAAQTRPSAEEPRADGGLVLAAHTGAPTPRTVMAAARSSGAAASPPSAAAATIAAVPPPAPPRLVPAHVVNANLLIDPNDAAYRVAMPPGLQRAAASLSALVKLCVSEQGVVTGVDLVSGTGTPVDRQLPGVLRRWRYRPFMVAGRPAPFCTMLRYEIAAR